MALLRMSDALAQVRANSKKNTELSSVGEALLEALEKDAHLVDEGRMKDIYTMQQDGASAKEIAKKLKLDVKTVKDILGEEIEEEVEITEGSIDTKKI
jgi:DNA-binding NarL/FixJ family response regulator